MPSNMFSALKGQGLRAAAERAKSVLPGQGYQPVRPPGIPEDWKPAPPPKNP